MTSSRVPRATLHTLEANDRVNRVLNRLNQAGLLRVTRGETDAQDVYEVAHEALVRNWPRLMGWLDEARDTLRQRSRLLDVVQQWQQRGRSADVLLRGQALDEATHILDLSGLEAEFVAASQAALAREQAEKETQQRRELDTARRLAALEQARAEQQAPQQPALAFWVGAVWAAGVY